MVETWTPVQPLADDDLNQRYWRELKVGDRVRVRLSGECDLPVILGRPGEYGVEQDEEGHFDLEDGALGTIVECPNETKLQLVCRFHGDLGHPFVVFFDQQLKSGSKRLDGCHYAASELEPLP